MFKHLKPLPYSVNYQLPGAVIFMVKAVEPTQLTYQPQEKLINNHGLKPQAYLNECFKAQKSKPRFHDSDS